MKKILVCCLYSFLTIVNVIAAPSDYGRDLEHNTSPIESFVTVLIIIGGIIIYNVFKKEGAEERGCIAVIIAAIILFVIVYMINMIL